MKRVARELRAIADDLEGLLSEEGQAPDETELQISGVIQDSRRGYSVSLDGRSVGDFKEWDEAWDALNQAMEKESYWPDIYHVNERGNVELLDGKGNVLQSWV